MVSISIYAVLLLSAFAFLISAFSFFYFRSYLKRRTGQERILSELRDEVDNILKSIDETTERDISLVEEREKSLKSLLDEIEKRLKVYIREMENYRDAGEIYAPLPTKEKNSNLIQGVPEQNAYQELGKKRYASAAGASAPEKEAAPQGEDSGAAFPLPRFRVKTPGGAVPAGEEAPTLLPLGEQVRELVRAGFDAPVIASRLGVSIAEVEFAAALLERNNSTTGT